MAIITASDYKAYAGITGTALDARLAILVPIAQRVAEDHCNVAAFDYGTYTERHSSSGDRFVVRVPPISDVDSLSIVSPGGATTALTSDVYRVDEDSGVVSLTGRRVLSARAPDDWAGHEMRIAGTLPVFPEDFENLEIVYDGGFGGAGPATPAALKYALYRIIDGALAATARDPAIRSESIGKYAVTFADDMSSGLSAEVRGLLAPYVRAG